MTEFKRVDLARQRVGMGECVPRHTDTANIVFMEIKSPGGYHMDFGASGECWVRWEARQGCSWKVRLVLHCKRPQGQWKGPEHF